MSPEREQFLDELVVTLIENFGMLSWFRTEKYDCPDDGPVTATIVDDEGTRHDITRDTMSRGIDVIRRARLDRPPTTPSWSTPTPGNGCTYRRPTGGGCSRPHATATAGTWMSLTRRRSPSARSTGRQVVYA